MADLEFHEKSANDWDPRPLIKILPFNENLLNGSNKSMDVNGSGTAQDFTAGPGAGEIWYIQEITLFLEDPGTMDAGDFGSISGGLSNGLQLLIDVDGTEYEIANFEDNMDLETGFARIPFTGFGEDGANGWMNEDDVFSGKWKFYPPISLVGDDDDQFIARVRDNLTGLSELEMRVIGYKFLDGLVRA